MIEANPLSLYQCHKRVRAMKIWGIRYNANPDPSGKTAQSSFGAELLPINPQHIKIAVNSEYMNKHKPQTGGYYILYEDGYESYSPAEAFEDGYTKINLGSDMTEATQNTQPEEMSELDQTAFAMSKVVFEIVNTITTRVIMPAKMRGADPRVTIMALLDAAYVLSVVAKTDEEDTSLREFLVMMLNDTAKDVMLENPPTSFVHAELTKRRLSFDCNHQDIFDDQAVFMLASGQSVGIENESQINLYANLVEEEARELTEAVREYEGSPNRAEAEHVAKEACDVIVVAAGVLQSLGFNPGHAWTRVMGSNLSKIDPKTKKVEKREDGKVLKGPNFRPADLSDLEWKDVKPCDVVEESSSENVDVSLSQSETA